MYHKKPIKPYRMLYLSPDEHGQRRGMILSRLTDGTIVCISGTLDRWALVQPQRTRTRRAWAIGECAK